MAVFMFGRSTPPLFFHKNFAENSWAEIIKACQLEEVPDTWLIGDSKPMTINGVEYQIDIIGKNHDGYSDGTGWAPLTFQLHDCYATKYMMDSSNMNTGGYSDSEMHKTRLPAILKLMPSEVQIAIRAVNKSSSWGSEIDEIETYASKLFLLSEIEISGTLSNSFTGEGKQYQYYKDGKSKVKRVKGSTSQWWTRSPYAYLHIQYCAITTGGKPTYLSAEETHGVSFAFCF
jgi:hypothetical protein